MRWLSRYNRNQVGLHTYVDKSDNQQYMYTDFEAYYAKEVFPCFDQPSLKAKMSLVVMCANDWVAVSNGAETKVEQSQSIIEEHDISWFNKYIGESNPAVFVFEQTPVIPSYLFAICAGPYHVFKDTDLHGVPQRIFVRRSLKDNMNTDLVFGTTKHSIDFYSKSYGQRFPFSKCDHVFVPDYLFSAMENIGCIVYNDATFCSSKEMSVPQLTFFSIVVQHELCHMWFGNYVTMKWWNDLWLNEAFATVLSYVCCAEDAEAVRDYKEESWIHFNGGKLRGICDDMLPSNHPVAGPCLNTDEAESLFDALTYQKGSSLMKQLIFIMGWDTFCDGLKLYFETYKWKNTILDDFISCMQKGYDETKGQTQPLDLNLWAVDWLRTKGVNKIQANFESEDGEITKFSV